jgi:hypothetical protein
MALGALIICMPLYTIHIESHDPFPVMRLGSLVEAAIPFKYFKKRKKINQIKARKNMGEHLVIFFWIEEPKTMHAAKVFENSILKPFD